jgi:hypothetical protein
MLEAAFSGEINTKIQHKKTSAIYVRQRFVKKKQKKLD